MTSKGTVANINYVMKLRILFGFYHNVYDCGYKRYLMKTLFLVFGACCLYLFVMFDILNDNVGNTYSIPRAAEYVCYFLCSFLTADKYILEYYTVDANENKIFLKNVRRKLNVIIPCYMFVFSIFFILLQIPIILNCSVDCPSLGLKLTYFTFMRVANEIGRLPIMMIFILFYFRVKQFCKTIYDDILNNTANTLNWKQYVINYNNMLETLDKTAWPIKLKMIVHLSAGFLNVTFIQFHLATVIKKNTEDRIWTIIEIVHLIYYYTILFCPSIIMERISEHINILKIDIANRMITCTDERRRASLRELLRYLREQPLEYSIWRTIPIDARLPLHFISLAATYLVCLMQFTHLLEN